MCSTPANKSSSSSQFSPITVAESPVKKILQSGNLTGNPRRVRDLAAELFNTIQDWNAQQLLGIEILNNILNIKGGTFSENTANVQVIYPENLQEQCDKLEEIVNCLEEKVQALETITQQLKVLEDLEKLQGDKESPLFLTWPIEKYGEVANEISTAYRNELQVKVIVKESAAHSATKDEMMYYIIAWVHQPYINDNIEFLVESVLQETGHR